MKTHTAVLGMIALMCLIISLPMEWMTLHGPELQFGVLQMTVEVSGLNGYIGYLFTLPIWMIVGFGLLGIGLGFINVNPRSSIPRVALFIPLLFSTIYIVTAFIISAFSSQVTLKVGLVLATIGVLLGLIYLLTYSTSGQESASS